MRPTFVRILQVEVPSSLAPKTPIVTFSGDYKSLFGIAFLGLDV